MDSIRRLGLKTKIMFPFTLMAVVIIALGILNVATVRSLVAEVDDLSGVFLPSMSDILNADRDLYQAYAAQQNLLIAAEQGESTDEARATFQENADQAADRMASARERMASDRLEQELSGFQASFNQWRESAERVNQLAANGDVEGARAQMNNETVPRFNTLRDFYDDAGVFTDERAVTTASKVVEFGRNEVTVTIATTIIALLVSGLIVLVGIKLIVSAVTQLKRRMDDIAEGKGDLTKRVPVETHDELGQLADSCNGVLANLQTMVGEIKELAENLDEGASDLSRTSAENRDGINHQTEAITQVATAINEVQSAIEEVASNAGNAAEVTRSTQQSASSGSTIIHNAASEVNQLAEQIQQAVEVIQKLSEDSSNITTVLDVIRGIADQTNLLALNAAIEAARAGEHGRGFSVVADEVRTLAQRTQTSTTDIQEMITNLQNGVSDIVNVMETGRGQATQSVESANEAEKELASILEGMNQITDINSSVASATEQQTQAVEEINQNVTRINDLAQDSDERSRNLSSISEQVAENAQSLSAQVARFRV